MLEVHVKYQYKNKCMYKLHYNKCNQRKWFVRNACMYTQRSPVKSTNIKIYC